MVYILVCIPNALYIKKPNNSNLCCEGICAAITKIMVVFQKRRFIISLNPIQEGMKRKIKGAGEREEGKKEEGRKEERKKETATGEP